MNLPLNPDFPYYLAEADLVELVEHIQNEDQADWDLFLSYAEPRDLTAGEVLMLQGESDSSVYVLTEGELEVRVILETGAEEKAIAQIEPIAIIGEQTFLDDGPRTATIAATTASKVHHLTRTAFDKLRVDKPDIACAFLFDIARTLSLRIRDTQSRGSGSANS